MTKKLICEGGASGHLAQMQELGDLKFSEIKDIFEQVFSGEIELKEKIDGIALTVTMKNGDVYFSRNKSTLKNPMSVDDAIEFFSDRNDNIRTTFTEAIYDLRDALRGLNPEEQESIFENGHNFINLEIVNVGSTNIIDYGLKRGLLIFHGLQQFDDNWHQLNTDASKAAELYNYLKSKNLLKQAKHDISGPAVLKINNSLKASKALLKITNKLNRLTKNLSEDATLLDYVTIQIVNSNELKMHAGDLAKYLDTDIIKGLISRTKHPLGQSLTPAKDLVSKISNTAPTEDQAKIKSFVKSCEKDGWLDDAIAEALDPFVDIVIEAGQLLIECLSGFIAADSSEASKKLQAELDDIISKDKKEQLTPNELKRYEAALKRLDKFNKKINATEGIVFSYKGKIYKLTSTFGPLNQVLGLFKFKNTNESMVKESIDDFEGAVNPLSDEILSANKDKDFVIYIRGSFKPPHVGHIDMIKKYSEMPWGKKVSVRVMVSDPQKFVRPLDNGQIITGSQAVDAIVFLLNAMNVKNVDAVETSDDNPYDMMFNDITDDDFKESRGRVIVFGISDKEEDSTINGFKSLINSILEELDDSNLNVSQWPKFIDPTTSTIKATTNDKDAISATEFRHALSQIANDTPTLEKIALVKPFLPGNLNNEEVLDYLDILDIPNN